MIYDYKCPKCGVFEVTQKLADDPLTLCPMCDEPVKKIPTTINFELIGQGWPGKKYK